MKTQAICILCLFGLIAFAQQPNRNNVNPSRMSPQLLAKISQSVVTINASGLNSGFGSGFIIGANGLCVTNYHVLQDASKADVKLKNGKTYGIRSVIGFDPKADLVVFQLDVPRNLTLPAVSIANGFPRPGDNTVNISSPLRLEQTVANGNVSAVRKHKDHGYLIQITSPISSGSSGSPIFNMRGEVIGVISFGIDLGPSSRALVQNLNFGIASVKLTELLQKSKGKRPIALLDMTDDPLITRNIKLAILAYSSDPNKSIELLKTENRNNPKNYRAYEFLGWIYYNARNYPAGADAYFKANKISSRAENLAGYAINYSAAARVSGDKTLFTEAYKWLNESVRMKADPSVYFEMAWLLYDYTITYRHLNRKQLTNALNSVNLSLQYYNKPAQFQFYTDWAYITRGLIKEAIGQPDDALNDYATAIRIDPNEYKGYQARGELLALHYKEFSRALQDAAMALSLAGNRSNSIRAEVLHTQALIYKKWYDSSGDRAHLQTALGKLDEAYALTKDNFYLTEKKRMTGNTRNNDNNNDGDIFLDEDEDLEFEFDSDLLF